MIGAKSRLNLFDKIVLFGTYFLGFSILLSYLAPYINPKAFWPIAFFGLAYPPLLLLNVLVFFYWLARFKVQIMVPVICVAIGWVTLKNNIGFHKTTDTERSKTDSGLIRMMAYNVHSFNSPQNYNISTRLGILQLIKEQQPDIINIEEFHASTRGKMAVCDSIKKILKNASYYFQPFGGTAANATGLAIFTKYPIVNKGIIRLTNDESDTKSIYIDVKIKDKIVRVYCVHLQSFQLNAEDHGTMDSISQKGKATIKGSRRIGGKLKMGFIRRADQVKLMREEMGKCPFPYIVAGDFNDTPSSYAVNQMASGLKNGFREAGRGLGRTYNGDVPNYQIDYIMVSPQFNVTNYTVIEKKLSDHYAVRGDLLLP